MKNRDQIIKEIIDAFYNDLIRFDEGTCFEIDDPKLMRSLITLFITKKAQGLSDDELLTAFGDKSQMLDDWVLYLKSRLERHGKVIH
jgi:hypothetical protein